MMLCRKFLTGMKDPFISYRDLPPGEGRGRPARPIDDSSNIGAVISKYSIHAHVLMRYTIGIISFPFKRTYPRKRSS